jgi:hypothetical protein
MPAVTNGAKLVKLLIESGTPERADGPLSAARRCLAEVHAADGRVATAKEVADALAAELGEEHGTTAKARRLIATGSADVPKHSGKPIEDELLGDEPTAETAAPEPEAAPEPAPAPKPAKKK